MVILSARRDRAPVAQRCAVGADGCLLKPIAAGDLARAVSEDAQRRPLLCGKAQTAAMDYLRRLGAGRVLRSGQPQPGWQMA